MEARMPSATPAEVLSQRRRLILDGDADGYADLFAPDGVIEWPFAPPGAPSRMDGREAIRDYSEVVIVEMRARATLTTTGQSFDATSIQVLRIREGQILLFRDYANPRVLGDLTSEPRSES
jgi:ketosteroid isomerase-like protein